MRRIIYSVAASLDGYIAGPNGEFDWIPEEPAIDWTAFVARFDTVLMGRRTYQAVTGQNLLRGLHGYVFSRTLEPWDHPQVTILRDVDDPEIRKLRAGDGKAIWLMGGGELFRSFLEAGLVDTVEIGLVPILLGRGVPLLAETDAQARLQLTGTTRYPGGILLLDYDVLPRK